MKRLHLLAAGVFAVSCGLAAATAEHAHGHAQHSHGSAENPEQTDWGIAGNPKAAKRTIRVTASDTMRFTPAIIEVGEGETVKFELHNAGKSPHEMVLGTRAELEAHAAMMRKFPGMEHEEAHMTHVAAGRSGTIVWTFNRPGEFDFACLVPGHYEAGMTGRIRVVARDGHKH